MKLDPGFLTHWKTERLIESLGADGVVALLRLWGKAQIRREWKGLNLNARRLAMETKWKGDENHLFSILTDIDAPWLDLDEDGTYSIHGFEEHQKQVIHLWSAGGKGGRPKKEKSPAPSKEIDTSTYSSSSPIPESNGNHMVLDGEGMPAPKLIGLTAIQEIQNWINSLRPEWAIPAHWNYQDQQSLHGGVCTQINELSDQQKELIRKFLNTEVRKGDLYWQPVSRSKFVQTFPDVCASAIRWAEKNGHRIQPKTTNTNSVIR